MIYRKNGTLAHRIVNKDNILEIASFFEVLHKESSGELSFKVDFYDKSSISSNTTEVFDSYTFKRKDAETIYFRYRNTQTKNELEVKLNETYTHSNITNTYELRSSDKKWYNATQQKLEDVLSGFSKRSFFRHLFRYPWCLLSCAFFILISVFAMTMLGFEFGDLSSKATTDVALFIPVTSWLIIIIVLFTVLDMGIHILWPEMEFSLDCPKHIKRKKWQKAIGWIITTLIIPIIMTFILR